MINEKFLVNYIRIAICNHINYLEKERRRKMHGEDIEK
jgi:hypothetical protein